MAEAAEVYDPFVASSRRVEILVGTLLRKYLENPPKTARAQADKLRNLLCSEIFPAMHSELTDTLHDQIDNRMYIEAAKTLSALRRVMDLWNYACALKPGWE